MSISGNLLDVSVADVMQFIHLGGRTGTLVLESGARRAEIGFHRGRIISAWTPDAKRLGQLLLDAGLVDDARLERAIARQNEEVPRVSLGKILVEMDCVTREELRDAVAEQIEKTIYDLVTWRAGQFDFALDELRPVDDIAVYPGDILPDINLNTQIVVLEALRIFDEKNRDRAVEPSAAEPGADATDELEIEGAEAATPEAPDSESRSGDGSEAETSEIQVVDPERLEGEEVLEDLANETSEILSEEIDRWTQDETEQMVSTRLQVISEDREMIDRLRSGFAGDDVAIAEVKLWDAGLTLPGELPPVVLLDMRHSGVELQDIESFCRSRAHAAILAIADGPAALSRLYEAGALAALLPDPEAVFSCLSSVLRSRGGRTEMLGALHGTSAGFAKLRRVVADLRSGLLSATVALNLMQVISESVERAIMFVVRRDRLQALGAFGADPNGRPLADATHELTVPLVDRNALCEAINDGQTRSLRFDEAGLPEEFVERIGRPRTGQIVLFPVMGSSQVNSVVYTDNGPLSREIGEIEILELAAAQVGVAFENEMLRRKMARLDRSGA